MGVASADKGALTTEMLVNGIESTHPLSVNMREKIESLREWAKERAVLAN
jgi:hypothetical protein